MIRPQLDRQDADAVLPRLGRHAVGCGVFDEPEEALLLTETVEELLRGLDEEDREVVALSLQGYTTREISDRLGRAERTVRWIREGVRKRLERMHAESVNE